MCIDSNEMHLRLSLKIIFIKFNYNQQVPKV